jgi:hypothetical protein
MREAAISAAVPSGAARLHAEANRLHRAFFGCDAPVEVQRQYASALAAAGIADCADPVLAGLLERRVDLEALEIALRRRSQGNPLTQRFHVLCYLVEARPDYFDRFVNERPRFASGVLTLVLHVARSAYKLIKGGCLLWVHHVG